MKRLLLSTVLALPALCAATAPSAGFTTSYTDLVLPAVSHELVLRRDYDANASWNGWFGRGWSSPLEIQLEPLPDGSLLVSEGRARLIHHFAPSTVKNSPSRKPFDSTAMPSQAEPENCSRGDLARIKGGFARHLCGGRHEYFSEQGRLLGYQLSPSYSVKLEYAEGRVKAIHDSTGNRIDLMRNAIGNVIQATAGGKTVRYFYAGPWLLHSVEHLASQVRYDYDHRHRLEQVVENDVLRTRITYGEDGHAAAAAASTPATPPPQFLIRFSDSIHATAGKHCAKPSQFAAPTYFRITESDIEEWDPKTAAFRLSLKLATHADYGAKLIDRCFALMVDGKVVTQGVALNDHSARLVDMPVLAVRRQRDGLTLRLGQSLAMPIAEAVAFKQIDTALTKALQGRAISPSTSCHQQR